MEEGGLGQIRPQFRPEHPDATPFGVTTRGRCLKLNFLELGVPTVLPTNRVERLDFDFGIVRLFYHRLTTERPIIFKMGRDFLQFNFLPFPLCFSLQEDSLYGHFASVADSCPAPVVVYNMVPVTGIDLSVEVLTKMAKHPNIVGVKDKDVRTVRLAFIGRRATGGAAGIFF